MGQDEWWYWHICHGKVRKYPPIFCSLHGPKDKIVIVPKGYVLKKDLTDESFRGTMDIVEG